MPIVAYDRSEDEHRTAERYGKTFTTEQGEGVEPWEVVADPTLKEILSPKP